MLSCTFHIRLVSRVYKQFKKTSTKKTDDQLNKWTKGRKREFSKIFLKMYILGHQGNENETNLRFHSSLVTMAIIKKTQCCKRG